MKENKQKRKIIRLLISFLFAIFLIYITRDVEKLTPVIITKPLAEDFFNDSQKYKEFEQQTSLINQRMRIFENLRDSLDVDDQQYKLLSDSVSIYDSLFYDTIEKQEAFSKSTIKPKFNNAFWNYEWKIFLIRLFITLSILVLSIFLFIYFRKNKLAPFFLGFMWFAIFTFLLRCLVFVPVYGEWIRYKLDFSAAVVYYYSL